MLTPLENFHKMMRREQPQWLPLDIQATPPVIDLVEHHTGTRNLSEAFHLDFGSTYPRLPDDGAEWRKAYARLGVELPPNADVDHGVVWLRPESASLGSAYHLRQQMHSLALIESVEQLESLPWPDMKNPAAYAHFPKEIEAIHRTGRVAVISLECSVFEFSWYLRGMEELFNDLAEDNGIADWLLDHFMNRTIDAAVVAARSGIDVIGLGDDVGTQRGMMVSVEFWRKHFKPRLSQIIARIREAQRQPLYIRYHSDGDIRPIIGELAEIGVDILNPVQPECMPVAQVIADHQHHLAFWGIVGTQTTMPFGTPENVRQVVDNCADFARKGAAVVVGPTHVLEPDVPWENITALVEAIRRVRL